MFYIDFFYKKKGPDRVLHKFSFKKMIKKFVVFNFKMHKAPYFYRFKKSFYIILVMQ